MFVILDPITLPVTISETFFCTAKIEETNSGNDVPNAIIETPIINEGMPRYKPIFSPESVKNWEALIKTNRLKIKIVGHNNNCINFFAFPNNERVICLETTWNYAAFKLKSDKKTEKFSFKYLPSWKGDGGMSNYTTTTYYEIFKSPALWARVSNAEDEV